LLFSRFFSSSHLAAQQRRAAELGQVAHQRVVQHAAVGEIFDQRHSHFVVSLGLPTLYHHGWSAYDELLKVPLVMAMPNKIPAGVEVKSQVRLTDIAPTVLDILGLPREILPGGSAARGKSLLPLLAGQSEPTERVAFVEGQNIRALRTGGYAYLRRGDGRLQRAVGVDGLLDAVPQAALLGLLRGGGLGCALGHGR